MRLIAYVFAMVLAVPGVLLAAFFLLIQRSVSQSSLPALVYDLLYLLFEMVTWGICVAVLLVIALLVAGFYERSRTLGALIIFATSLTSIVIAVVITGIPKSPGEAAFFLFGLISMGISGRLIATEPRRVSANHSEGML
ncbi:MAG: hypothetical protein ABI882_13155 [Acidobacteriota bacterium]